jgi:haloacetate dehalogenase
MPWETPVSFSGFSSEQILANGVSLRVRHRRHPDVNAPAVLLLHGFPQTSHIWHKVVPELCSAFSVICPDLRGYGASAKPQGAADHANYSKRSMAQDVVALMDVLGYDRFHLVGHDRGGRVAHRAALDWPQRIRSLTVIDISPTLTMYEATDMEFAKSYFHWFFLIQPHPLPEMLIGPQARAVLHAFLGGWGSAGLEPYAAEALAEYELAWTDAATIHANCEDYRAAASIDLEHDRADRSLEHKIGCPVLVVWGRRGVVARLFDPLSDWQERAAGLVTGGAIDAGHFIPEEAPTALLALLLPFLSQAGPDE